MAAFKLQSALEYLMTYGWAILIIAIVIAALFLIGAFNGGLGTFCNAQPGYTCSVTQYSAATGNLVVVIGQSSGSSWMTANAAFVPTASESNVVSTSSISAFSQNTAALANLGSGTSAAVTLPVSAPGTVAGSSTTGYIWVQYTTATTGSGSSVLVQVATVGAKAT